MLHAFDSFDSIPSSQGAAPSAMTPALDAVSEEDGRDARVDAAMSGAPRSPRTPGRRKSMHERKPGSVDATSQRSSSPSARSTSTLGVAADCVKVVAVVRPLIEREVEASATETLAVAEDSVGMNSGHQFTYDGVVRGSEEALTEAYETHVREIVDGSMGGYNGCVLAYGQTGSGKTYTMGMGGDHPGMAQRVFQTLFSRITEIKTRDSAAAVNVRASFIEIYKDDILDLLLDTTDEDATSTATTVTIRENPKEGGVYLNGARTIEVDGVEGCLAVLNEGICRRSVAESTMNVRSSRSHAVLTLNIECKVGAAKATLAKLHLVDLAGSERVTLNETRGQRFKEGVQINMGLLALSNCIAALTDLNRREWGHIPYRDSKLTRLLQDSLGGNSRTVMFACVSPADSNTDETLSTLKYASRARSIRNRVAINFEKSTEAELKLKRELDEAKERIAQLEMLVNVLHDENKSLKEATPDASAMSRLMLTPDGTHTPQTPLHTPIVSGTPLSELLMSCKRARARAEILLSTKSPTKSPMRTPRGSVDFGS